MMIVAQALGVVLFQGVDLGSSDIFRWLVAFVGVIALCSLVQLLALVGAALFGLRAYKSAMTEVNLLKGKALPLVASVQGVIDDNRGNVKKISGKVTEIVDDVTPKVKKVTTDVTSASDFVVAKLKEYEGTIDGANQTLRDVNEKTRAQVNRVDGMVASALKATSDVGTTIHRSIRTPVVEIAGVVNGAKAALDTFFGRSEPVTRHPVSRADEGGFTGYRSGQGPMPVPPSVAETPNADPSNVVAPSPGAEAVVERFRNETLKR